MKSIEVNLEIITIQRDHGNQTTKLARLKYTIDRLGVEAFKRIGETLRLKLEEARGIILLKEEIIMAGSKIMKANGIIPCSWKMEESWIARKFH